jgi:excisionase family DNA binding protein
MLEDRYLTVADVAELLKLNQQTVRNWIDAGELAAIRVGARRVRVRESDLEKFIASSTTSTIRREPAAKEQASDALDISGTSTSTGERERFRHALQQATQAAGHDNSRELGSALRTVAEAATRLADSLSRQRG